MVHEVVLVLKDDRLVGQHQTVGTTVEMEVPNHLKRLVDSSE